MSGPRTVGVPMPTANRITSLTDAGIIADILLQRRDEPAEHMAPAGSDGRARLESYFEKRLTVSRSIALTGSGNTRRLYVVVSKSTRSVRHIRIGIAEPTYLSTIEDVEELHPQFGRYALAEVEVLTQADILVFIDGIPQGANYAGRIAQGPLARITKSRNSKHRQAAVIVFPIHTDRSSRNNVGAVSGTGS